MAMMDKVRSYLYGIMRCNFEIPLDHGVISTRRKVATSCIYLLTILVIQLQKPWSVIHVMVIRLISIVVVNESVNLAHYFSKDMTCIIVLLYLVRCYSVVHVFCFFYLPTY